MLNGQQPNQKTLGIKRVGLCALLILLSVTACQSAPATIPSSPTPAAVESQSILNGPVSLGKGIWLRKVMEVGPNNIRLVRNPVNGDVYVLDSAGSISRISNISAAASREEVASLMEIKGTPTGIAFGPDGTLYAVVNTTVDQNKNQVVVRKGVPNDKERFTWETLASSEPYPLSNTYFDHLYNGIVVSPDGQWLYINGGSRTDHGEVEDNGGAFPDTRDVAMTSKILRLPVSATELTLPNDEAALTAQGLILRLVTRNSYCMAFAPHSDLVCVDYI